MKKGLIFSMLILLCVLGIVGLLTILKNTQSKKSKVVLNNVLNALEGKKDYLNNDIDKRIKEQLLKYQEENLVPDDTSIVILDNVELFNRQVEIQLILKEIENYYNNLPLESEGENAEEKFSDVDLSNFDEEYSKWFDISAIDVIDNRIIEENNQYLIKLNDLKSTKDFNETLYHKGFSKEISIEMIEKETYTMRQNNLKYKYYLVDIKSSLNKTIFICASTEDKHIIEIEVGFNFLTPNSITIK